MKIGLHGLPPLDACPTRLVRSGPPDGGEDETYAWFTNYVRLAKAAGIKVLPVFDWHHTNRGLPTWVKVIDSPWCEYGNEPRPEEWTDPYRHRLRRASPILRDAGKKVILAAAQTGHSIEFLDSTPDKVFEAVDAVALHPYARSPQGVLDHIVNARKRIPDHLPIYVTEVGWAVGDPIISPKGLVVAAEAQQAYNLTEIFGLLRMWRRELKIVVACWFMHQDTADPAFKDRWWRTCGIIREDGTHRPSYDNLAAEVAK